MAIAAVVAAGLANAGAASAGNTGGTGEAAGVAAGGGSAELRLSLPIACEPGKTCFLQSYVDVDTGPDARDFTCATSTYEGHKGTDFRVLSSAAAAARVAVLASADGAIKGGRDGMEDVFATGPADPRIINRECGNGVVIDHGGGWETQYCHMRKGSVVVKNGDKVTRGQRLGDVGNSGLAEFAHLHLSVRKDGKVIDPYTGREPGAACALDPAATGLWTTEARAAFPYAGGEIIDDGFAKKPPQRVDLEVDHDGLVPAPGASEIYYFARVANIRIGDKVRMVLLGPGGFKFENTSKPLDINRQIHIEFASARTGKGGPLPAGDYKGTAELIRGGQVISKREGEFALGR